MVSECVVIVAHASSESNHGTCCCITRSLYLSTMVLTHFDRFRDVLNAHHDLWRGCQDCHVRVVIGGAL